MKLFFSRPELTQDSYWIGYEHIVGTIWRWKANGKTGAFQQWDIGEPDSEGRCARMTPYGYGAWRDWECNEELLYICKKFAGKFSNAALSQTCLCVVTVLKHAMIHLRFRAKLCSAGSCYTIKRDLSQPCQATSNADVAGRGRVNGSGWISHSQFALVMLFA